MSECPFCGRDPYHYVDIGVGYEAVAVTCCELGTWLEYDDKVEMYAKRNQKSIAVRQVKP